MASITRKQVESYNAACKNGFVFDLHFFLTHGEKSLVRVVKLADGSELHAQLWYTEEYEPRKNAWGQSFKVPTGRHIPQVNISRYYRNEGSPFLTSHGMGKFIEVGQPSARRMFSALQKLTADLDDAWIMQRYENTPDETFGGLIIG